MRKLLVVFLLLAQGVNASLDPEPKVLLLKETSGGYVPPDRVGWSHKITIFTDGKVVDSYRENGYSPWQDTLLAELSPIVIDDLQRNLVVLTAGNLDFPSIPECVDAPTTTYQGLNGDGEMIEFAATEACRLGILDSFFQSTRFTKILDAINLLIF